MTIRTLAPALMARLAAAIMVGAVHLWGPPAAAQAPEGHGGLVVATLSEMAPDLRLVLNALLFKMRGFKAEAAKPVVFGAGVGDDLMEPVFLYRGFDLVQVVVSAFERRPGDQGKARIEGALRFADRLGRRVMTAFVAEYQIEGERIVISRANLRTLTAGPSQAVMFFVPAKRMAPLADAFANHVELLVKVAGAAVPMAEPAKVPRTVGDYYAVGFVLDRLPPGTQITAQASRSREGTKGMALAPMTVNYEGWRVVILRGRFALGGASPFFFKLVRRRPSGEAATLAGVFSTALRRRPGIPPAAADGSAAPKLVPLKVDPALSDGIVEAVDGTMQKVTSALKSLPTEGVR